jgi:hypothetical protein
MSKETKKRSVKQKSEGKDLLKLLKAAAKNIYFVSEIDSDLHAFVESQENKMRIKVLHKMLNDPERKVEHIDRLRDRVSAVREWQNKKAADNARRYQNLFRIMEENLANIQVLRIGEVELKIYLVGYDRNGRLAGFWVDAVET